jgi:hypothetical protein
MTNVSPGLALLAGILLIVVILSRGGRMLVAIALLVGIALAAKGVFIRTFACPRSFERCFVEAQPAWHGPCVPSERSGILKINQAYFLTAEAGVEAQATCVSIAFWQ